MIKLHLQKQYDLGLFCLSWLFWQATSVRNFTLKTLFIWTLHFTKCLFFTLSSSCMFFRAGWHRVGLYKLLAKMDFHVIAVDYRGNVQDFVLKLLA